MNFYVSHLDRKHVAEVALEWSFHYMTWSNFNILNCLFNWFQFWQGKFTLKAFLSKPLIADIGTFGTARS